MSNPSTLGPWLRRFLAEYIVTERNLARNTQKSYRDTFALLLPFVRARTRTPVERLAVHDLTARRVRQFLDHIENDRGCSAQTRNQRLSAIRAFARFVASRDPGHLEWSASIRAIASKKATPQPIRLARQDRDEEAARGSGPQHAQRPDRTRPPPVPLQHRGARLRSYGTRGRRPADRTARWRTHARQHPRQGRKTTSVSAMAAHRSRTRQALAGTGGRRCRLPQPTAKALYAVSGSIGLSSAVRRVCRRSPQGGSRLTRSVTRPPATSSRPESI